MWVRDLFFFVKEKKKRLPCTFIQHKSWVQRMVGDRRAVRHEPAVCDMGFTVIWSPQCLLRHSAVSHRSPPSDVTSCRFRWCISLPVRQTTSHPSRLCLNWLPRLHCPSSSKVGGPAGGWDCERCYMCVFESVVQLLPVSSGPK